MRCHICQKNLKEVEKTFLWNDFTLDKKAVTCHIFCFNNLEEWGLDYCVYCDEKRNLLTDHKNWIRRDVKGFNYFTYHKECHDIENFLMDGGKLSIKELI